MAFTTYSYDDTHNILTITDPDGNVVKQYYDGLDRLTEVVSYNGSSIYSTVSYAYNYQDQQASVTTALGNITYYYYDSLGRLTETLNPGDRARR